MTEWETTKLRWGPKSQRRADLENWRQHIINHVKWIDENRAELPVYQGIRKVYLREFLRVSIELQRRRIAANRAKKGKREAQFTKAGA
jgi:hypothetical protein